MYIYTYIYKLESVWDVIYIICYISSQFLHSSPLCGFIIIHSTILQQ